MKKVLILLLILFIIFFNSITTFVFSKFEFFHGELLINEIKDNDIEGLKSLLENDVNPNGETIKNFYGSFNYPLIYACKYGNIDTVKLLIEYGANTNVNNGIMTPLVAVTFRENREEIYDIATLLLENSADINADTINGVFLFNVNVFHPSILDNEISLLLTQLAIEYHADVNYIDSDTTSTALMNAIRHTRVENARLLLEHGADFTTIKNKDGKTAYDLAREYNNMEIIQYMDFILKK